MIQHSLEPSPLTQSLPLPNADVYLSLIKRYASPNAFDYHGPQYNVAHDQEEWRPARIILHYKPTFSGLRLDGSMVNETMLCIWSISSLDVSSCICIPMPVSSI